MLEKETKELTALKSFFIEHISRFCDKCGTQYTPKNIKIVNESTNSVIIQAQCDKCKATYMAHIIKPLQMTKKIPIKLDIAPELIKDYYDKGHVTADEVLSFRKKLQRTSTLEQLEKLLIEDKVEKQRKVKKDIE